VVDDLEGRYRGVSHLGIRHRVRPQRVWNALFLEGDGLLVTAENAVMGVAIAVISFVGSMGNVPFAVALWGGGINFAGVIAFVYADLITIPVLNVYRKYYGWRVMLYILGVFFVTMAFTGFLMELLFDALGIVPNLAGGETATDRTYFERNYTFYLNLIAFALSGFLLYVYRRGLGAPGSTAIQSVECGPMIPDRPRRTTGRPTTSARRRARRRSRRIRQRTRPIGRWFTLTALTTRPSLIENRIHTTSTRRRRRRRVLDLPNDRHWNRCATDHPFGHAAEQHA